MLLSYRTLKPTLLLLLVTTIISSCGGSGPSEQSSSSNSQTETQNAEEIGVAGDGELPVHLKAIIDAAMRPAIAAFSISDGEISELAAVGLRSADHDIAVTIDDLWHAGSIGKSMTATLCAFLVDGGYINWNSTIIDIFPEWETTTLRKYHEVQLQQLLSHVSGITDNGPQSAYDLLESDLPSPEVRYLTSEIVLNYPHDAPQNSFKYANLNYFIAAAMLERVTGQTWRELIIENVFIPIGMYDFGFGLPGDPAILDQPTGHIFMTPEDSEIYPSVEPAGVMHFSLQSMANYAMFHLRGIRGEGSLLSEESYEKLYTPVVDSHLGGPYAMGWVRRGERIYHAGTNTRWFAHLEIDSENNRAYFAVSNSFSNGHTQAQTRHGPIELFIADALDLLEERLDALGIAP